MNSLGFQKKSEKKKGSHLLLASSPVVLSDYEGTMRTWETPQDPPGWPLTARTHTPWRPCSPPYRATGLAKAGLQHARQTSSCPRCLSVTQLLSDVIHVCVFFHVCQLGAHASRQKEPIPEKVRCTKHTGDKSGLFESCLGVSLGRKQPLGSFLSWAPRQAVRAEVALVPRTFSNRAQWLHRRRFCA